MDQHSRTRPLAAPSRHVEIADDDVQEVVEIVGNPADQLAHGLQPGILRDGFLGLRPLNHLVLQLDVRRQQRLRALIHAVFHGVQQGLALGLGVLQPDDGALETIQQQDDDDADGDISRGLPGRGPQRRHRRRRTDEGQPRHDGRQQGAGDGRTAAQQIGTGDDRRQEGDKRRAGNGGPDQPPQCPGDGDQDQRHAIPRDMTPVHPVLDGAKNARHNCTLPKRNATAVTIGAIGGRGIPKTAKIRTSHHDRRPCRRPTSASPWCSSDRAAPR